MGSSHVTDPRAEKRLRVTFADNKAAELLSGELSSLRRPEESGFERVKHNASRTVYRGSIAGEGVYLKHYHGRSFEHRLRRLLAMSIARREMWFSQYLLSRGVSTPRPLAAMVNGKTECYISAEVAPAVSGDRWHLDQLARGDDGHRAVRRATVAMAEMVARMHSAGVIHEDLHCGNVLMCADDDGVIQLVLTDLHRMKRRRRLSRRRRAANLALLFHDRYGCTTRTDRLRFLVNYLRASDAEGTLRGWQRMIEHFAHRHRNRQHAGRDKRIFKRNRYFAPLQLGNGWRGHVVLASKRETAGSQAAKLVFTESDWRAALAEPDKLFSGEGVEVLKDSASSLVVRRRLRVGEHELDVYIKRSRRKHFRRGLADCIRPSRAIKAFKHGHQLLTRRIATALPLAALERRRGPFLLDNILITEAVEGRDLHAFLNTWLSPSKQADTALSLPEQRQLAQAVLWQLGRLLRRLHDNLFAHRDLKASNLLIRWSPPQRPDVVLIDLDGLRRVRLLTTRRRFQGLMRLNVSLLKCPVVNHAGRLRMLLGYLRRPGSPPVNFKPYWRVLEQWSASKLRFQIRSRRRRQRATRRPGR